MVPSVVGASVTSSVGSSITSCVSRILRHFISRILRDRGSSVFSSVGSSVTSSVGFSILSSFTFIFLSFYISYCHNSKNIHNSFIHSFVPIYITYSIMKFCLSALIVALSASVGSSSNAIDISALSSNDSAVEGRQLAPEPDEPCVDDCECGDLNFKFIASTFTVAQAACGKSDFSILCDALNFAGLFDALNGPDSELTVWAPTNAAFLLLPESTREFLFSEEGKETLTEILLLHVATPALTLKDLECDEIVDTLGQPTKTECKLTAGGTRGFQLGLANGEVKPEMTGETMMCNGNLIVLDKVMIPGGPGDTFSSSSKSGKSDKKKKGKK